MGIGGTRQCGTRMDNINCKMEDCAHFMLIIFTKQWQFQHCRRRIFNLLISHSRIPIRLLVIKTTDHFYYQGIIQHYQFILNLPSLELADGCPHYLHILQFKLQLIVMHIFFYMNWLCRSSLPIWSLLFNLQKHLMNILFMTRTCFASTSKYGIDDEVEPYYCFCGY